MDIKKDTDQALGISRGGRGTKIHAITDGRGRPLRFILSGGHVHDRKMAEPLLETLKPAKIFIADKGYDCDGLRTYLNRRQCASVIPGRCSRKSPVQYCKNTYKQRNAIERMFCRLKDFRRIATRYDKSARHFMSALCIVALFAFWIVI